jgi:hypothetical protein
MLQAKKWKIFNSTTPKTKRRVTYTTFKVIWFAAFTSSWDHQHHIVYTGIQVIIISRP